MTTASLSAETVKNFLYASTATVSMQMMKRGFRNCAIGGVKPLNPKATRLVGPAYTLRYIPAREDLDKPPTPADPPSAQRAAIEETPAGHVLVIGTEGNTRSGTLGDILALLNADSGGSAAVTVREVGFGSTLRRTGGAALLTGRTACARSLCGRAGCCA